MDAREWDERYAAQEMLWSPEPNRFVAEELAGLPQGRALDVACGEGRNALWLAERGWRVTAFDFSAVAVDRGRRLAAARGVDVDLRVDDALTYDPEPAAFDLVVWSYLQLPSASRRRVLSMAASALRPGGLLFVVGHARANLVRGWGGPRDEEVLFDPGDLVAELGSLRPVVARWVERDVEAPDGPRTAVDTLVRAQRPTGAAADPPGDR